MKLKNPTATRVELVRESYKGTASRSLTTNEPGVTTEELELRLILARLEDLRVDSLEYLPEMSTYAVRYR